MRSLELVTLITVLAGLPVCASAPTRRAGISRMRTAPSAPPAVGLDGTRPAGDTREGEVEL